jgi:hypothetical protein
MIIKTKVLERESNQSGTESQNDEFTDRKRQENLGDPLYAYWKPFKQISMTVKTRKLTKI